MAISYKLELITPELAGEYLKHNTLNRNLYMFNVRRYAEDMKNGTWGDNPSEPISFAEDGTLLNGQNRLHAIMMSGVSVSMWVCRGVDKNDFKYIDTGKSRSAYDLATIERVPNARNIVAIVRDYIGKLYNYSAESATSGNMLHVNNREILEEYFSSNELYQESHSFATQVRNDAKWLPLSEVGGIYVYLIKEKKHEKELVEKFFTELVRRDTYPTLFSVRKRLEDLDRQEKVYRAKSDKNERQVLLAKAWNTFLSDNKQKTKVLYKAGEKAVWH